MPYDLALTNYEEEPFGAGILSKSSKMENLSREDVHRDLGDMEEDKVRSWTSHCVLLFEEVELHRREIGLRRDRKRRGLSQVEEEWFETGKGGVRQEKGLR